MTRLALSLALLLALASCADMRTSLAAKAPPIVERLIVVPPPPEPGMLYTFTFPTMGNAGTCSEPILRANANAFYVRWRWNGASADSGYQLGMPGDSAGFMVPASAESVWVHAERDGMSGCVVSVGNR